MHRAYIAGFMDGEGSIRLRVRPGRRQLDPTVEIVSTHRETLDAIAATTGVGRVELRGGSAITKRTIWRLRIEGRRNVRTFLSPLMPYLFQKRARAQIALDTAR